MASNRAKYLVKNTVLFTISSFGSKLISFFLVPLYTNVLSTSDYGAADLISTTVKLLLFVFSLNITSGVLRFSIDNDEYHGSYLQYGIKIFVIGFALLGVTLIPVINAGAFGFNTTSYWYILSMYFFLGLHEILSNYFRARDKIALIVIAGIATTLVTVIGNIVFLLGLKIGFTGYMLSIILGQLIACLILLFFGRPKLIHQPMLSVDQKKEILFYSIPLIFNGVAWWINQSLDKYFITSMLSLDENGIYAVASKIPTILSTLLTIFMQAWNLSAIKEYKSKDSAEFYANTYKTLRCFLSLCASGLIVLSIPIARIMFAKDFFVAWRYSSILLLAGIFSGMSSFLGSIFSAAKKSNIFAYSTVAAAIVNISLNALLIPKIGIQGATIATAISFFTIWIIRYFFVQRFKKIDIDILSEMVIYLLLIIQIILEQHENHYYVFQACIIILIAVVCRNEIVKIIKTIKAFIISRKATKYD